MRLVALELYIYDMAYWEGPKETEAVSIRL